LNEEERLQADNEYAREISTAISSTSAADMSSQQEESQEGQLLLSTPPLNLTLADEVGSGGFIPTSSPI
jgi:hypothetical protein